MLSHLFRSQHAWQPHQVSLVSQQAAPRILAEQGLTLISGLQQDLQTQGQEAEAISHTDNLGPSPDPCISSCWRSVEVSWLRCTKWKRSSAACRMAWRWGGLPVTLLLCCPASTAAGTPAMAVAALYPVGPQVPGKRLEVLQPLPAGMHLPGCNGRAACAAFPPLHLPATTPPPAGTAPGGSPGRSQELGQQAVLPSPQTYLRLQQSSGPASSPCSPLPGAAQPVAACCTISRSAQPCLLPCGWIRAVQKKKTCLLTALLPLRHNIGATSS